MASSYLTYKEPRYSDLIGDTPTNLLPKWLFNREYTPLPDVMAEAEKMAQIGDQQEKRNKNQQIEEILGQSFNQEDPESPLNIETSLKKAEEDLFKAGMIEQGLTLNNQRRKQEAELTKIQRQLEQDRKKAETPRYVKFGDAIFKEYPDGRLEMDRPVPKSQKSDKPKAPPRPSQVLDDMLAQQVLDKMQREQAPQSAQAEGPGMLDQAGAWLSGMLNQPTVNPRARQVTPPLDAGAAISGDPRRRVITVRRKAIEQ